MIDSSIRLLSELQRIVLTANGCLQQIYSAIFQEKVNIEVILNDFDKETSTLYRQVVLKTVATNTLLYTAFSIIEIHDEDIINDICSGQIGLGQIFEKYQLETSFQLQAFSSVLNSSTDHFKHKFNINLKSIAMDATFYRSYSLLNDKIISHISEIHFTNILSFKEEEVQILSIDTQVNNRNINELKSRSIFYQIHKKRCTSISTDKITETEPGLQLSILNSKNRNRVCSWERAITCLKSKDHLNEALVSLTQSKRSNQDDYFIYKSNLDSVPNIEISSIEKDAYIHCDSGWYMFIH